MTNTLDPSSQIPLLTFNSLYNILREEKRTKSLQALPKLFYEALSKFLADKKEEIKKLKNSNDNLKLKKEQNIYKNSKKITTELLNLRCMKISNIAIKNELFGEETLSDQSILEKEIEFQDKIKKATKSLQNSIKNN
jgi:DNA replication initiation complex subunit (GINS family)